MKTMCETCGEPMQGVHSALARPGEPADSSLAFEQVCGNAGCPDSVTPSGAGRGPEPGDVGVR
jgi:hypothetical protein